MIDLPSTAGGWGTIVADPPWQFRDRGSRAAPDWKARHGRGGYLTMPDEDIIALPVEEIAAKRSHLYLWTTDAHLGTALLCVLNWGFDYKQTLVWSKRTAAGRPALGLGHWFRHAHELVLFAVRGKAPALNRALPSVFDARRSRHSQKPEHLQDLAELLSPGPRLELFARRLRLGWTTWGNQI